MQLVARIASKWLFPMAIGAAVTVGIMSALKPPKKIYPVLPVETGMLYRSGQLEPTELAEEIRTRGIKTVVNLGSMSNSDVEVCQKAGVKYFEFPSDVWYLCGCNPPGEQQQQPPQLDLTPLWQALDDPSARPVLVHCQGGVHRTGVVTAMYRIERQGWQPEDAIREMDLYGFESDKDKFSEVLAYLRAGKRSAGSSAQSAKAPAGAAGTPR